MGNSLESSRPIMAPSVTSKRTSKRFSTFSSGAPSLVAAAASDSMTSYDQASTHSSTSTITASGASHDPRMQEIKEWTQGFDRLEQKRLTQQRYAPTPEKTENLSKLALGAKVERALGRRMTDQDATFRKKVLLTEKDYGRPVTTSAS